MEESGKMATVPKLVTYEDWLEMPAVQTIEVFFLEQGKLKSAQVLVEGRITPKHFPEASIDVTTIWPD